MLWFVALAALDSLNLLTGDFSFKIQGPHLLAPTGCDLRRYGKEGTVFAGYHYDLNFLTIHGRSRFPGLNIWLRNEKKVEVKVPVGCLLIQTGKQVNPYWCLLNHLKWKDNQNTLYKNNNVVAFSFPNSYIYEINYLSLGILGVISCPISCRQWILSGNLYVESPFT